MGIRRARMVVAAAVLVAMTLLGVALAPAGASTGWRAVEAAASGRAPPASATPTSRCTATAATTSGTTC